MSCKCKFIVTIVTERERGGREGGREGGRDGTGRDGREGERGVHVLFCFHAPGLFNSDSCCTFFLCQFMCPFDMSECRTSKWYPAITPTLHCKIKDMLEVRSAIDSSSSFAKSSPSSGSKTRSRPYSTCSRGSLFDFC